MDEWRRQLEVRFCCRWYIIRSGVCVLAKKIRLALTVFLIWKTFFICKSGCYEWSWLDTLIYSGKCILKQSIACKIFLTLRLNRRCNWVTLKLLIQKLLRSQPGVAYKSIGYRKTCNFVLQSSKHEEMIFPYEFIFEFMPHFIRAILSKDVKWWVWRKYIKGVLTT